MLYMMITVFNINMFKLHTDFVGCLTNTLFFISSVFWSNRPPHKALLTTPKSTYRESSGFVHGRAGVRISVRGAATVTGNTGRKYVL